MKKKIKIILFLICFCHKTNVKCNSISDSLQIITIKDVALVVKTAVNCQTCFIHLTDRSNYILKEYYFESGREKNRIEYEYYSNYPGQLYSVKIYQDSILKEFRKNINISDSSTYDVAYYFDNGKIYSTGHFKKGKQNGVWNENYTSGILNSTYGYSMGVKEGRYKEYYENKNLKVEGEFKDDKINGRWIEYDTLGEMTKHLEFIEGELITSKMEEKKLSREEKVKKQLEEFRLDSASYSGCIYFLNRKINDTIAILNPRDIVLIQESKNLFGANYFHLKAVRGDTLYVTKENNRSGKTFDVYEFPLADIKKLGFNTQTTAKTAANIILTPAGFGLFAPKGYTLINLNDEKYKIILYETCK